jgi:hypothetical protein
MVMSLTGLGTKNYYLDRDPVDRPTELFPPSSGKEPSSLYVLLKKKKKKRNSTGALGSVVVKALCYKSEGFHTR